MISSLVASGLAVALSGVFFLSSAGKLLDPSGFMKGVAAYRVLPNWFAAAFALALIPLEGFVSFSLATGISRQAGALIGVALLTSFFIAVGLNVHRHATISCHCFGSASGERVSVRSLVRIVLLAIGILVTWQLGRDETAFIPTLFRDPEGALVQITVGLFIVIIGMWLQNVSELRQLLAGASQPID